MAKSRVKKHGPSQEFAVALVTASCNFALLGLQSAREHNSTVSRYVEDHSLHTQFCPSRTASFKEVKEVLRG